jgi:lipopolysaccharide heptosyltransferase II
VDLEQIARRRGTPLRILITRLRYLGDVILTTPALTAVKRRYPEAEIHYLAERPYADVLKGHPDLAGIISLGGGSRATIEAILAIRRRRFTAAVDLFYNPRSALMLFLSGIPIRVGGSRRARRRLFTHVFTVPPDARSAIAHHLAALHVIDVRAPESAPRIYLTQGEAEAGERVAREAVGGIEAGRPLIAVHPGGTWPAKRWSAASFSSLAEMLAERLRAKVLVLTGPGEEGIAGAVERGAHGAASVLPPRPLRIVAAVLNACGAVVANDGGVLHMAVALGRPTVGVFGPTEPEIWFPYEGMGPFALATRRKGCAPCHKHVCEEMDCLNEIEPAEVYSRLEDVLAWRHG